MPAALWGQQADGKQLPSPSWLRNHPVGNDKKWRPLGDGMETLEQTWCIVKTTNNNNNSFSSLGRTPLTEDIAMGGKQIQELTTGEYSVNRGET